MTNQPLFIKPPALNAAAITSHVTLHPLPLAAILDHHLRRPESQDRVFGALLGSRSLETGEVEVKSSFGVPYAVTGKDIAVDSEHHRLLLDLHFRVSPKDSVIGWYATNPTLNSFSALLQDFYNIESSPHPALHLTLNPVTLEFKTYIASPVGLASSLNLTFKCLPNSVALQGPDRTGVDLLAKPLVTAEKSGNLSSTNLGAGSTPQLDGSPHPLSATPLGNMHTLLVDLKSMLGQMTTYVQDVIEDKRQGDVQVGKYLLESMGAVPIDREAFLEDFQSHLSDVLMVSYLANLVRAQTEISGRLNLLVS